MIKLGNNNIGKIYLGSNSIGKAYLGSNLVFQKGSGPSPQPTTTIPYIRNTGNAYINTGITADNNTRVIVWARNFNPNSTILFGSRIAGTNATYGVFAPGLQNSGALRCDFGSSQSVVPDSFTKLSGYHKYELDGPRLLVDDVLLTTAPSATFSNNLNIFLFAINTNGTTHYASLPIDICACKIYKSGTLVRDFMPVSTPSIGLYDAVSDTVFTNAGSGSFTYGTFNPDSYTPLEYVECDGNQYFDSGAYGTYSDGIVTKFIPTNTTAQWTIVLGYRESSNCCDIALGTDTDGQDNMRCYWRFGTSSRSGYAFNGSTSDKLTNKAVVAVKSDAALTLYYNNAQIGTNSKTGISSSFQTTYPLAVGTACLGEDNFSAERFIGRFYYVGFGSSRSFVPAKVNNVAGMYDTYNDVFYVSETNTPFIAGPTI